MYASGSPASVSDRPAGGLHKASRFRARKRPDEYNHPPARHPGAGAFEGLKREASRRRPPWRQSRRRALARVCPPCRPTRSR